MITRLDQLDLSKVYTYTDYLTWQFKERVELLAGKIFRISPGPSRRHQEIVLEIGAQFHQYLKGEKCKAYVAPFDVRLSPENVVQPDVCVICDPSKLDDAGCKGAPELVAEIISPSSVKRDLKIKFDLYEKYGVQEYWVIDPLHQTVTQHVLDTSGHYKTVKPYALDGLLKSACLEGFQLDLSTIFEEPDDWNLVRETTVPYQKIEAQ